MTIFDALLTESRGRRAAELRIRLNKADHRPRRLWLIEEKRLLSGTSLPFVWRFAHEPKEPQGVISALQSVGGPTLTVVAAPGVTLYLEGFPDQAWTPAPGLPVLNIYRVQDPAVLPRLATDVPATRMVGTYEVAEHPFVAELPGATMDDPPTSITMGGPSERHFIIEQLPGGAVIEHVASGDRWTITVPQLSRESRVAKDAQARYAFEIDLSGRPGDPQRPLLKIVTTPQAEVTLMESHVRLRIFGAETNARVGLSYWNLWEVDSIDQVPAQGSPIEPGPGWRWVDKVRRVPNSQEQSLALEQTVLDIAVGLVPVVGDAVDIAELLYGVATGQDKWGRPVTLKDLALLGLGAVLPFVASGAMRGARRLVQRFAEHADDASDLVRRVRAAGLSAEDVAVIQKIETLVKAGRQPPTELWDQALGILRRVPGSRPPLEFLLNADGSGFAQAELQTAYQRYTTRQAKQDKKAKGAAEWARSVTTGRPRQLLVALLGPDYARQLPQLGALPMNLLDIPRPAGLTDAVLATQKEAVSSNKRLWERLGELLAEPADPGAASLGLLRRQVSSGRFRILKGNVAEILSMDIQRAVLARIAQKHPTAVLVSGVRVRLMKNGKLTAAKLFSDNIIVVKKGNQLHVLAVFEVKSGFKGGGEAAEQIFEWIEKRMEDGSELVLSKGTTFTAASADPLKPGRTWTSKSELVYTWKPADAALPTVTGLGSRAERHLITAQGSSALGVDSGLQTAAEVSEHHLAQTSAELDYLCADILLGRSTSARQGALPVIP